MNMRECERLKPGAMVREAYESTVGSTLGMVLSKKYVEEEHYAKVLGAKKQARFDLYVHWFKRPVYRSAPNRDNPEKVQCWEVKLLKNGE
tara:strand:- start:141 stop:410 length:270 start_codon:yes stop_codon:yes gene_type:complete